MSAPDERAFVARTRRLDADVDLLDLADGDGVLFQRGSHGFAGRGTALVIPLPGSPREPDTTAKAVHDALGAIERIDSVGLPGCGPVAFGALPFDPRADAELVVPETIIGRADNGTRWMTTITPAGAPDRSDDIEAELWTASGRAAQPSAVDFTVRSTRPPAAWCNAVEAARDELREGHADKVVLAREVVVTASDTISVRNTLERLRHAYPGCMLYSLSGFVGASPELLVARSGDIVRSHPMAGTTPRSADPSTDARLAAALLASTKDREEHRITIDMVHDTLLPWCSYLDEEAEPSVVAMANVQHLATMVEGRLSSPPASVIELMTALHPTPAVCGSPRAVALELISRYEELDRGRYAGPVGWVDADGDGEWAVGIRCAQLDGATARLYAGVGVVPDSDPLAELAETQAKLQALLSAVIRP